MSIKVKFTNAQLYALVGDMQSTVPTQAYLNGSWVTPGKATFEVRNPATAELLTTVSDCGTAEAETAIETAHAAFLRWRGTSAYERAALLMKLAQVVRERSSSLAKTMTLEQGKPVAEALREVLYGASYIEWFAEEAKRVYGEVVPHQNPQKQILVVKEALGVVAAITPWNFPHAMIARKMAAALAAGCTCIVKPSPETPLSALALAECCHAAGIPPGVFSVLPCLDPEPVARVLLADPRVRKISFTGSTEVGKLLYQQSAATVKKLTLELGGNAPCIIAEDAALEPLIEEVIFGKFRNAGQTCVCINRFLVHQSRLEEFTQLLCARVARLRVGNGLENDCNIGPLISQAAVNKVRALVDDALAHGANCRFGGLDKISGQFFPPMVLTGVTPSMKIWREEVFGPVATITSFSDDATALTLANDTEYGLASYVYTTNLDRAFSFARGPSYGIVGVNDTMISVAQAPFGGVKQSGFGREGSHFGIDEYLSLKYIVVGLR